MREAERRRGEEAERHLDAAVNAPVRVAADNQCDEDTGLRRCWMLCRHPTGCPPKAAGRGGRERRSGEMRVVHVERSRGERRGRVEKLRGGGVEKLRGERGGERRGEGVGELFCAVLVLQRRDRC